MIIIEAPAISGLASITYRPTCVLVHIDERRDLNEILFEIRDIDVQSDRYGVVVTITPVGFHK